MEKSYRKCAPKASPTPLFTFDKSLKTATACKKFKNKVFSKRITKKPLYSTLYFLVNPVPFNGQHYQKQKGPGTGDQSLFRLQNKF